VKPTFEKAAVSTNAFHIECEYLEGTFLWNRKQQTVAEYVWI
jgi:hypothetical protein